MRCLFYIAAFCFALWFLIGCIAIVGMPDLTAAGHRFCVIAAALCASAMTLIGVLVAREFEE